MVKRKKRTATLARVGAHKYSGVDGLRDEFDARAVAVRQRLSDFASVKPHEYFYELVYCLLTPQSSAVNAAKAIEVLKISGLAEHEVDPAVLLHQKDFYIRFHNTKGKHITEAKQKFGSISAAIVDGHSSRDLRAWLVKNVKGLGWKEASHFLRNIGHRDLAILDRHILRNLKKHNVIRVVPKTLTSKQYLNIERKFMDFSSAIGIAMDELDLLFWSRETGQILK